MHTDHNRLTQIIEYEMDPLQAKAFKLSLQWEKLCTKEFPDEKCAKLRKTGDPRKSDLFRWCYKLVRETYGLVEDEEYRLYILAQLHVIKVNRKESIQGRIAPNCLCGEKAWRRWRLWKKHYDKKSKAHHTTIEVEENPNSIRLKKELIRTKEYLENKGVITLQDVKSKLDDYSFIRWVTNTKIHPIYAILSPFLTKSLNGQSLETLFQFDFSVYKSSITPEIETFFQEQFGHEFV